MNRGLFIVLCTALICLDALAARADVNPITTKVGVDEHVGDLYPTELWVTDHHGKRRQLSSFLHSDKPLLLAIAYYHCRSICDLSLREMAKALRDLGWKLGSDYNALTVSIDPRDKPIDAAAKRSKVLGVMHIDDDDVWPFTVSDEATIKKLMSVLGYRYAYDEQTEQYAHPAVSVVFTPKGEIAHYLYGPTLDLRSARLSLREARLGRGGPTALVDRTILSCFHYDPATHKYGILISGVLRGGAVAIALLLSTFVAVFVRRGRTRRASATGR